MAKKKKKETTKAPDNVSKYELKDKRIRERHSKGHYNEAYGEKPPIINSSKELLGVLIALLLVAIYALS